MDWKYTPLPKETHDFLKQCKGKTSVPISKLIQVAVLRETNFLLDAKKVNEYLQGVK